MGRLSGKVAAVTGGASGIGEATVRLFVEEGAHLAFADRDSERGNSLAAELSQQGGEVLFVEARMEREAEATGFIQRAVEHFGRLDILVNNAGIRLYQTVTEASEESWDTILGVNLKGYVCAKAAIPLMQRTGGQYRQHCLDPRRGGGRQYGAVRYHQGCCRWPDTQHGP